MGFYFGVVTCLLSVLVRYPLILAPQGSLGTRVVDAFEQEWKKHSNNQVAVNLFGDKHQLQKDINKVFEKAAETTMKGILQYTDDPIVSVDVIGNTHSAVFDSNLTAVLGDKNKLVKVVAWYDNEMGYSSRLVELIEKFV